MSRTITALFNDRSEAEAAAAQLRAQIGSDARIVDQSSGSSSGTSTGSGDGRGFWSELKDMFVADDDRATYEEGVRRGHYLLTASVPEEQADRACGLIEGAGAIDIDENEQQWRSEGWSGGSTRGQSAFSSSEGYTDRETTSRSNEFTSERGNIVDEERIPVIEEQLRVGKREVERGGARVRSYIEERPVSEQVNLREEHVHVERRPVDEPISSANLNDDLLRERSVEMRETAEEAVVGKEARVKEEIVVQKTAEERTEQVEDTVRNTRVDVDEGLSSERSALFENDREPSTTDREFERDRDR
ncbi:MAG TPA: YsnF/AvaK domain-containing protein [Sphingomicrobium sp.]